MIQSQLIEGDQNHITKYQYNERQRLIKETQADGTLLEYEYDDIGNKTQLKITRNNTSPDYIYYRYDALNRLKTVTEQSLANKPTQYEYDKVGNRLSIRYANGIQSYYQYNELNRLTDLTTFNNSQQLVSEYHYILDANGKRIQINESNGRSSQYIYDKIYRLKKETITDPINGNYQGEYTYDEVSNRIYSIVNGVETAYSYDNNDRLSQQGGVHYSYDNNGSLITETEDSLVTSYTYNAKKQLKTVQKGGNTTHYLYNIDGIRIDQNTATTQTHYLIDSQESYSQVLQEQINGITQVQYLYGDDLISQTRGTETSTYLYDGLGSTRQLSNQSGEVTDHYNYSAYGELLNQTGTTENNYLFAGEQYDQTLGQYYLRARYYDPKTGRFTQMDDFGGFNEDPTSLHKYAYANANPIMNTDPSGRFSLGAVMAQVVVMGMNAAVQLQNLTVLYEELNNIEDPVERRERAREITAQFFEEMMFSLLTGAAGIFRFKAIRVPCNSFQVDTEVSIKRDDNQLQLTIEEVIIGDLIWSYNEKSGEMEWQEVVHLIQSTKKQYLVDIELETGNVVKATGGHPFNVGNGWVIADDLKVGDAIFSESGEMIVIAGLTKYSEVVPVYNLTVEEVHNYFVGVDGVLGHNTKKNCGSLNKKLKKQLRNIKELSKKPGRSGTTHALTRREVNKIGKNFVGDGYSIKRGRDGEIWFISKDKKRLYRSPRPKKSTYARTGVQANFHERKNINADWFEQKSVSNVHVHVK